MKRTAESYEAEIAQLRAQRKHRRDQVTFLENRLHALGVQPYPTSAEHQLTVYPSALQPGDVIVSVADHGYGDVDVTITRTK